MKKILYFLAFTLISLTSVGKIVDFSGTWNLNKPKSTLNDQFSMAPSQMILMQTADSLNLEKYVNIQGQDITIKDKLTLDGKECINVGWEGSKKKSNIVWSADEMLMTVTSKIPLQDGSNLDIIETYQMEGDQLKIVSSSTASFGNFSETYLFDKQ